MSKVYDNSQFRSDVNYQTYLKWCTWVPAQEFNASETEEPSFLVHRSHPDAVLPCKSRASDSGYDLTVIKEVKKFNSLTTLYDTCIKIRPPAGFYADVVPRSSLSKSGYMLANSVGVIDRAYVGNIMIALIKVDPTAPDLKLPFTCAQMIFRPIQHFQVIEVPANMIEDTERGSGGFGSTEERKAQELKRQKLDAKN